MINVVESRERTGKKRKRGEKLHSLSLLIYVIGKKKSKKKG